MVIPRKRVVGKRRMQDMYRESVCFLYGRRANVCKFTDVRMNDWCGMAWI